MNFTSGNGGMRSMERELWVWLEQVFASLFETFPYVPLLFFAILVVLALLSALRLLVLVRLAMSSL